MNFSWQGFWEFYKKNRLFVCFICFLSAMFLIAADYLDRQVLQEVYISKDDLLGGLSNELNSFSPTTSNTFLPSTRPQHKF
jgi:hypothetical protein